MMFQKKIIELKIRDNFSIIDKTMTKILMFCICIFIIFNGLNFIIKDNYFKSSIIEAYRRKIENKIKPSILNGENIKFYTYKEKINLENKDVYNEVIYFTRKKDIGILINKAKDLIDNSSINVQNEYIEVKIKKYDEIEEIASVVWNRDNKNEYLVYIK